MKTTKTTVIMLALVLLTAVTAQSDEKPAKKEISNTQTASCLVKITADEAVLPLDEFTVDYLLRSSGVAGKAAREVLGISPDGASELFEIEEVSGVNSALGGYGVGFGGMDLWADSTPGGSIPGSSTLGATPMTSSTRPTTPAPTRTPTRTPTTRTRRPRIPTTTTTRRTYPTRTTTPTRPKPTLTQSPPSRTEQTILFRLQVDLSQASTEEPIKPAAEEFMMALIENLRSALSGAFSEYRSKLDNQLVFADNEAIRAEKQLVEMQAKLRDISGSRDLSRYAILRDISELRQKLQTNMMDMTSYKSTIEATTKQIAGERVRRMKLIENDPITREFKSIVDVHEKRLKDTQKLYDVGRASAAELEDVKEKIIRARIELAKRQEEVSKSAGGDLLSSLNQQIANLSIKENETMAQIENLQKQIAEAESLLSSADEYELVSLKADIARQNLEETLLWCARLGRNIRSVQPPDVTVIGAE